MYFKSLVTGSLLAALLLVAASPVVAGKPLEQRSWIEVTTRHFVIRSVRSEKDTLELVRYLEAFHAAAAMVTGFDGLDDDIPIEIYILKKPRDATQLGMSRTYSTLGIGDDRVHRLLVRGVRWEDLDDAARHAYAHLFVSGRFPMWLETGLAEYLAATKTPISSGHISIGLPRRYKLKVIRYWKPWSPMSEIVSSEDHYDDWTRGGQRMFFSEAWVLVHYLFSTGDYAENTNRYLEMMQSGMDSVPAFETAYGIDAKLLNKDIKNYLTASRFAYETFDIAEMLGDSEFKVVRLTPPQVALGLAGIASVLKETERAENWYKVAATDKQTRPRAESGLGLLLLSQDNHEAARSKMDLALSLAPDDAHCWLNMGLLIKGQAEQTNDVDKRSALLESARMHLLKSRDLDNGIPATYSAIGHTYYMEHRYDEAVTQLEMAENLMPSSSRILVRLAEAYAGASRKDDAVRAARSALNSLVRLTDDTGPATRAKKVIAAMSSMDTDHPAIVQ